MSWPRTKLELLAANKKYAFVGGPFGSKLTSRDYVATGTPVIRGSNLNNGRNLDLTDFVYVSDFKVQEDLSSNLAYPGDLVFTQRGTLGQVALIPIEGEFERYVVSQSQMKMTVNEHKADPLFLYYYFSSHEAVNRILSYTSSSGVPHINLTVLRNFEVPTPPLKIQNRIASVLSAYDELIENNRRRIQLLEESARLLYKEWFVRLRFPGHEHVKVADGVPEGWEKKPLSYIANITMGQSPKSEFYNTDGLGIPFHQGVKDFGHRFPSNNTYCTAMKRIAEAGDILFSVRAPVGRINVATEKIVIGRGLSAIRSIRNQQSFLLYNLKNHFFKEDMIGAGAIYAAITKKDLYNVELLQPSDSIIEMFLDHVNPIDRQIDVITNQTAALAQARDILIPKLMNGEVGV
ncbi:restriction endonuclease subunit S [Maridesulfovibrio sp.]|uniref:restriction endonuclease subunit S n=1 Tax=Maridesulfovibrio sp. TaxID=2795000 RepID=UPI0029CA096C|nr:restriction endonuclease subunit S [Maridesulfovibrio sp.]